VPDPRDAEDILQDVFYELVEANRLLMPVERAVADEEGELLQIEDLLPSPDAGPEALYLRSVLLDVLELHELEGRSFKEMAAKTGVGVNTLLSRKRYAVRHLRERLQSIYDEFTKG